MMALAQHYWGKNFPERKRGEWKVIEKLQPKHHQTGGTFSVGYKVEDRNGRKAFMKSTDIGLLIRGEGDTLVKLQRAANEQTFEREILDFCQGNSMDKVVHALDYGDMPVVHNGINDSVFFIIFPLARGDARSVINPGKGYDFLWTLSAMHSLSVAVQQLHTKSVAHNDIKPSNLLVFEKGEQKLSDLGRATSESIVSPFEAYPHPGDMRYAPPERIYRVQNSSRFKTRVSFDERRVSDLYLLGSMGLFFTTGLHTTWAVDLLLRSEFLSINWQGTFEEVLPQWRDAFSKVMMKTEDTLMRGTSGRSASVRQEFLGAIRQLCEPDPNLRGHPANQVGLYDRLSTERYVSLFSRLKSSYAIYVTNT